MIQDAPILARDNAQLFAQVADGDEDQVGDNAQGHGGIGHNRGVWIYGLFLAAEGSSRHGLSILGLVCNPARQSSIHRIGSFDNNAFFEYTFVLQAGL
jgi:hypothetical protein